MTESIEDTVQGSISFHNNDTAKFRLLWTIKEYTKLKQSVKHPRYIKTKSPLNVLPGTFSCEIRLYPNGDAMCAEKDHTSISIRNSGKFGDSAWFSYKLALMDKYGKEEHVKCAGPSRFYTGSLERISEWFHSDVLRVKLKRLFPNDSIQIVLEGMVLTEEPVDKSKSTSHFIDCGVTSQVALYRDKRKICSDVTLSVGLCEFQVHKVILCSKSSVFQEIFEKSSRNIIVIPDIRAEVFREIVNFMYTDTVTAMFDTMHTEVLIAAKKYELNYLAEICEIRMIRSLSVDNCLEYLQTADKCGTRKLKKKSLEYIRDYRSYVFKTQQWKDFRSEESKLLLELLDNFMNCIGGSLIMPKNKKQKAIGMLDSESE